MASGEHFDLSLKNQICFSLYSATHRLMRIYRPLLKELNLTYPQYLVMLVLWEEGATSVNGLGEKLQLDSGTLTPLLKRMEKNGLVNRLRSLEDERVVEISLTPTGKKLRAKAVLVPEKVFCLSALTGKEALPLKTILEKFAQTQIN